VKNLKVGKDGLGKWSHDFSVIVWDEAQHGDRSLDLRLGKESDNSKHSKASVVDFFNKTICFGFFGSLLVPSEGVEQVEGTLKLKGNTMLEKTEEMKTY